MDAPSPALVARAQVFENDSEEVQREWVKYTQKVDKKMEEALRYTVKKSLQVRVGPLLGGTPLYRLGYICF